MRAAFITGMGQWMFEQRQKRFRRQAVAHQVGHMAQEAAGHGKLQRHAGGIIRDDAPAIEKGGDLPGQGSVGGDEGRGGLILGGLTQTHGDGQRLIAGRLGLQKRDIGHRLGQIRQVWPIAQPLIGDRGGTQGKGNHLVPLGAGRRGGPRPAGHIARVAAHPRHELRETILRMVFRGQRLFQRFPDILGHIRIKPGKHHRPLRKLCHRLHQDLRRPT